MDSTQSRLDLESEEDIDSLHLPLSARWRSESNILLFMSIFLGMLARCSIYEVVQEEQEKKDINYAVSTLF